VWFRTLLAPSRPRAKCRLSTPMSCGISKSCSFRSTTWSPPISAVRRVGASPDELRRPRGTSGRLGLPATPTFIVPPPASRRRAPRSSSAVATRSRTIQPWLGVTFITLRQQSCRKASGSPLPDLVVASNPFMESDPPHTACNLQHHAWTARKCRRRHWCDPNNPGYRFPRQGALIARYWLSTRGRS
jgi:hypothetical protein